MIERYLTRGEKLYGQDVKPANPELKLANQLIDGLVTALPIIRQQQHVPPEMLEYGRGIMNETRLVCDAQGWSMPRLMLKAFEIIDAPKDAA